MNTTLCRSGRTTRMLAEAHRLAREDGVYVIVVVARHSEVARLRDQFLHDFCELAYTRVSQSMVLLESGGSVVFTTEGLYFDWRTLRRPGVHPRCITLVDHFAVESAFGPMLAMLHRYDPPAVDLAPEVKLLRSALRDEHDANRPCKEVGCEPPECCHIGRLLGPER